MDWSGIQHCRLNIEWNNKKQYVDLSMPNCISNLFQRFALPHKRTSTSFPLSATSAITPYKNAIQHDAAQHLNQQETP